MALESMSIAAEQVSEAVDAAEIVAALVDRERKLINGMC
jgi:hypothetical protein